MSKGADQKLCGRQDARSRRTCVTVLHNGLFRQRGSGFEVMDMYTFEYTHPVSTLSACPRLTNKQKGVHGFLYLSHVLILISFFHSTDKHFPCYSLFTSALLCTIFQAVKYAYLSNFILCPSLLIAQKKQLEFSPSRFLKSKRMFEVWLG